MMTCGERDTIYEIRELVTLSGFFLMIFAGTFLAYTWNAEPGSEFVGQLRLIVNHAAEVMMCLSVILYAFGGMKEARTRRTAFTACCFVVCALGIAVFMHTGDRYVTLTALTVFSAVDIDYRKILKVYAWTITASFVSMFIFLFAGCVYDRVVEFPYGTGHALGAPHPNSFGRYLLVMILLLWLMKGKDHMRLMTALSWASAVIAYCVAMSRSSALLLLILPGIVKAACTVRERRPGSGRLYGWMMYFFIAGSFLGTIMIMICFERSEFIPQGSYFWNMAERIQIPEDFFRLHGVSLLGSPLYGATLDMGFTRTLLHDGILAEAVMIAAMLLLNAKLIRFRRYDLMTVYLVLIAYTYMEHTLDVPAYGFIMPALFADIGSEAYREKRKPLIRFFK